MYSMTIVGKAESCRKPDPQVLDDVGVAETEQ